MNKGILIISAISMLICLNAAWLFFGGASQDSPQRSIPKKEKTSDILLYQPRPSEPKPESHEKPLFVEQQEYDLGDSVGGDTVQGEATIINRSNDDYSILDILTSCGCTSAKIDSPLICSEQSLTFPFSIRTDGEGGVFVAKFQVNYKNEKTDEMGQLYFSAKTNILTPGKITAIPPFVSLGQQKPSWVLKETVILQLADGLDEQRPIPSIIEINAPEWIDVTTVPITPTPEGRLEGTLELNCTIPNSSGTITESIRLITNNERYPILTIPISVNVEGYMSLEPQRIVKVLSTDGFSFSQKVNLNYNYGISGKIVDYKFHELEGIVCRCEISDDSPESLTLHFEKDRSEKRTQRGVFKGSFSMKTNILGEIHEISLPILIISHVN